VSVTLTFVALDCGTNFGGIWALFSVVPFKILILDVILYEGVWVLDLLGWEDGEGLDTESYNRDFLKCEWS